ILHGLDALRGTARRSHRPRAARAPSSLRAPLMRLILTCALFSSLALATPRVALITVGGSSEVARAEVESVGLQALPLPPVPPAGRLVALGEERTRLTQAVDDARQAFIATRFADARAIAERAEREAQFRGEPEVARRLAELSVMAALCGDKDGF